jgi:hypothetical protein
MLRTGFRTLLLAAGIAASLAGCAGNRPLEPVDPNMPTMLEIDNDGRNDMRIYVYRGGQRIRLGTANMGQTTTFKLPRSVLAGAATIRVIAEPIAGRTASISEEIMIVPGDRIAMRILP